MEFSHNSIKFQWYFRIGRQSFIMKYFATRYPKNMINMSFYRPSYVLFNKIFVIKFGSILKEIWIFEVGVCKSMKKECNIEYPHYLIESQWYFRLGTKSWMIKFFATTYPKNMINMSFDRESRVLFIKIFVIKFRHMIEEIWIFEVGAFKSTKK